MASDDDGGFQGYSNWDTWNTKLHLDNEQKHYDAMNRIVGGGGTPEQVRDYALRHVVGPVNKQAIADAHEWNSIPEHDRLDHSYEDLKDKNPQAADLVNGLGFGPDVSDSQPDLIDPELVNWQEIHNSHKNAMDEEARYIQQQAGQPAPVQPPAPHPDQGQSDLTLPDHWTARRR